MWYSVLLPVVWFDLKFLIEGDQLIPEKRNSTAHIRKHAWLVRDLKLCVDRKRIQGLPLANARGQDRTLLQLFPNLTSLKIALDRNREWMNGRWDEERATSYVLSILINNKNNRSRQLIKDNESDRNNSNDINEEERQSLQGLKELEVRDLHLQQPLEWMSFYEDLWSRLEVLTLTGSWWVLHDDLDKDHALLDPEKMEMLSQRVGPATLRDLTLETYSADRTLYKVQAWIIQQCVGLTRLRWSFHDFNGPTGPLSIFFDLIKEAGEKILLPDLHDIAFAGTNLDSRHFTTFIQNRPRVSELDLSRTYFCHECWKSLQATPRHLESLTVLMLDDCPRLSGSVLHEMLCSLPNLDIFCADQITDEDIEADKDNRPWVCLRLRSLHVSFKFPGFSPPGGTRKRDVIAPRLATLERLEFLNLRSSNLRLTLSPGDGCLDLLHGLRRLKEIGKEPILSYGYSFDEPNLNDDHWSDQEVAWARKHWPELKFLRGFSYRRGVQDPFPPAPSQPTW
ncbi:hypothetical protein BGZ83_008520 [Gryganskiella cystojenkinii]|nr:hypothetical protein BGZ83_008520 [Gryganskiella cystojenkinii]